jgi:hypothetical protein
VVRRRRYFVGYCVNLGGFELGWVLGAYEGAEGYDYSAWFERHLELFVVLEIVC